MPFENHERAFRDILEAIDLIREFTQGMDFETFRQDAKTVAAVERKLQLISEAAIRFGIQKQNADAPASHGLKSAAWGIG